MDLDKIKVGETYYGVGRRRMGNTTRRTVSVSRYKVTSVDPARQIVEAMTSRGLCRLHRGDWSKWRVNKPVLIETCMPGQHRLATREELKAMRAAKNAAKQH